jgi:hypothetical protein
VAEIRAAGGTKEEQALRALQYVQERIRYASIAIGRGSYEPTAPQTVLDRLFGDCKDKSLLLAAMLTELGVQSNVALVNTGRGRALDGMLPTPYAFDHAIVRARIGESVYWLDPTHVTQYAPLATTRPADFERALSPAPRAWRSKRSRNLGRTRASRTSWSPSTCAPASRPRARSR